MSELESGTAIHHNRSVVSRSYAAEGALLENLSFALVSDPGVVEEQRQACAIEATPDSIQIVKQLIEFIKTL
jgi:hypothetical protein